MKLALTLLTLSIAGCAGSVSWDHCEPAICTVDCDLDEECPSFFDITVIRGPGAQLELTAFVDVQGSYAGAWDFSAETSPPVSASVTPAAADVAGGDLFPVDVAISLASDANPGSYSVSIVAENDGGDIASTSVLIEIPDDAQR